MQETTINSNVMRLLDEQNSEKESEESIEFNVNNVNAKNQALKYVDGQNVKIAGIITAVKKKITKSNKLMAFVTIEDLYGQSELIIFENAYIASQNSLIEENIILAEGRLSLREDEPAKIVANKISDFKEKKQKSLYFNIDNLESVCQDCHNKEHHAEEDEFYFDEEGNLCRIAPH